MFTEALLVGGWVLTRSRVTRRMLNDRLWQAVAAFVIMVLGLALVFASSTGPQATWAGLAFDLRYLVGFFLAYCLVSYGTHDRTLWLSRAKKFAAAAAVVLAIVGSLQVAFVPREFLSQFGYERGVTIAPYMTIDEKSPDIIRAFATMRGPNDYGAYLIIGLLAVASLSYSWRVRLLLMGIIGAGILLSQSRSAMLAAAIAVAVWGVIHFGTRVRKYILPLMVGTILAGGMVLFAALNSPTLRLLVFHSSPHDTHLTEGNIDGHNDAIVSTLQRIVEQPLGCGPGCSGPATYYGDAPKISENYYLQVAEEYGVVGLLVWLFVALFVVRRLWQLPDKSARAWLVGSFVGLSVIGLLLHVWVDESVSITWWLLAGAFIGYSEKERLWNKSKNNSPGKTLSNS